MNAYFCNRYCKYLLRVEKASLWNTTESDVKSRTSDCSTLWKWDLKSGQFARTYRSYNTQTFPRFIFFCSNNTCIFHKPCMKIYIPIWLFKGKKKSVLTDFTHCQVTMSPHTWSYNIPNHDYVANILWSSSLDYATISLCYLHTPKLWPL